MLHFSHSFYSKCYINDFSCGFPLHTHIVAPYITHFLLFQVLHQWLQLWLPAPYRHCCTLHRTLPFIPGVTSMTSAVASRSIQTLLSCALHRTVPFIPGVTSLTSAVVSRSIQTYIVAPCITNFVLFQVLHQWLRLWLPITFRHCHALHLPFWNQRAKRKICSAYGVRRDDWSYSDDGAWSRQVQKEKIFFYF